MSNKISDIIGKNVDKVVSKKVSDVMTCNIVTLDQDNSIKDAAQVMKSQDIGFIPIIRDNSLIGVVTDRDLVTRGYAEDLPENTQLRDVMTDYCIAVERDTSIDDVAEIMAENKIRRVCVLDQGELIGVCAIGDLAISRNTKRDAGIALSEISIPSKLNILITNH